jgi:hypothetical protein
MLFYAHIVLIGPPLNVFATPENTILGGIQPVVSHYRLTLLVGTYLIVNLPFYSYIDEIDCERRPITAKITP